MPTQFRVLPEHIILLQRAYVRWDDCETGAPAIDCKRPYGNSSVVCDVAKILKPDWEYDDLNTEQYNSLWQLHRETETALQIFLQTGVMAPGLYEKSDSYTDRKWKWVSA
jgi:hypothetical protein